MKYFLLFLIGLLAIILFPFMVIEYAWITSTKIMEFVMMLVHKTIEL
jgi:hypothetical protein